jgi:acetolactate decarboxylase
MNKTNFSKTMITLVTCILWCCCGCKEDNDANEVYVVGAMKNVMWKGELQGKILIDTITDKKGLYGLGPIEYISGEILINNGKTFTSKVAEDGSMLVEEVSTIKAPFFVYGNVTGWTEVELPDSVTTLGALEEYILAIKQTNQPFIFRLDGLIDSAVIHVVNLPKGSKVSSPKDAHQGRRYYNLGSVEAEIIGFYSTDHQGVFTHHDANSHMHVITKDGTKMGHLDELSITPNRIRLFISES